MTKNRTYKGWTIRECERAGNPHGGRWYVQTYYPLSLLPLSLLPWADEACTHFRTLAEIREAITAQIAYKATA